MVMVLLALRGPMRAPHRRVRRRGMPRRAAVGPPPPPVRASPTADIVPRLKGEAGEVSVAGQLIRLGFPSRHDVILHAPDGGLTQVDHVALTARGLLAIETKNYAGSVFGGALERNWVQVLGSARNRFQNPLWQNARHVAALAAHLRCGVEGLVVFAGTARFPERLPPGVTTLAALPAHLAGMGQPSPGAIEGPVWREVCHLVGQGRALRQAHRAQVRARHPQT